MIPSSLRSLALATGAVLAVALGCATGGTVGIPLSPVPAEPPSAEGFRPIGEVVTSQRSASFDDWRVVGPTVNLTRRPDGSWAGTIVGHEVNLKPGEASLSGPGTSLHFVRWGNEIDVRGYLGADKVQIRLVPGDGLPTPRGIFCRRDADLIDCRPESHAYSQGMELRGRAAKTSEPLMPQLGLALLGAMY